MPVGDRVLAGARGPARDLGRGALGEQEGVVADLLEDLQIEAMKNLNSKY
jgi:hypothetical protein